MSGSLAVRDVKGLLAKALLSLIMSGVVMV